MFSCRQGPRNVFACVFRHCCPCQIGQSILTKSFLFTRMSERPRHFDRLSTLATKSGSLSNIYSICTRLRFKKTNAVFQKLNANCSGNAIKRFCQIQLYFTKNSQNSFQSTARNSRIRADAKSIHFVCSFHQIKVKPIDTEDQYFSLFSHQKKIAQPLIITPCSKSG